MKWSIEWNRPKDIAQRVEYAKICASDLLIDQNNISVVVDDMNDDFNSKFGAWPTCFYVLGPNCEMMYIGEPEQTEAAYDIQEMFAFLSKWEKTLEQSTNKI